MNEKENVTVYCRTINKDKQKQLRIIKNKLNKGYNTPLEMKIKMKTEIN